MKITYQSMYKLIMAMLAGAAALFFAGNMILQPDISTNQKEKSHLIGASYMTMNNEFYEILNEQISHRVEAEGDRLILRDPALSVRRQREQIEMMLDMGISVLILNIICGISIIEVRIYIRLSVGRCLSRDILSSCSRLNLIIEVSLIKSPSSADSDNA